MVDNEKLYKEDLQHVEDRVHAVSYDLDQTSKAMQLATVTNRWVDSVCKLQRSCYVLSMYNWELTVEMYELL